MAYRDGAGGAGLGPFEFEAYGSKFTPSTYNISPASPAQGSTVPTLRPTLIAVSTGDPSPYSVQFDLSDDQSFGTVLWTSTLTNQVAGFHSATVSAGLLYDGVQYYWRVKAGTGSWSTTMVLFTNANAGPAAEYHYSNIGAYFDPAYNVQGMEQMTFNAGVYWPVYNPQGMEQMTFNAGVFFGSEGSPFAEQFYENITTGTPTPFIWLLVPDSARNGEGVKVYGNGFGDLQSTYTGIVEALDGEDWVPVQVVSWQTYPPTVNAYTALRVINPLTGQIDWQHTVIEILVESWMVPSGYMLRVRTDGP